MRPIRQRPTQETPTESSQGLRVRTVQDRRPEADLRRCRDGELLREALTRRSGYERSKSILMLISSLPLPFSRRASEVGEPGMTTWSWPKPFPSINVRRSTGSQATALYLGESLGPYTSLGTYGGQRDQRPARGSRGNRAQPSHGIRHRMWYCLQPPQLVPSDS